MDTPGATNRESLILRAGEEDVGWSGVMKKRRKNRHAVALGRLGGLVGSEAKKRVNRENGRKGGLVKSPKKRIVARRNARRPRAGGRRDEAWTRRLRRFGARLAVA